MLQFMKDNAEMKEDLKRCVLLANKLEQGRIPRSLDVKPLKPLQVTRTMEIDRQDYREMMSKRWV
jgi:hypothetical protein